MGSPGHPWPPPNWEVDPMVVGVGGVVGVGVVAVLVLVWVGPVLEPVEELGACQLY